MKYRNGRTAPGRAASATILTLAITGWLSFACGTAPGDAADTSTSASELSLVTVTVNLNDVHQTIDGFGVAQPGGDQNQIPPQFSAPWLSTYPEPTRSHIMDLAFSEVKGIGLTILRMRAEGMMEPAPGVWNDVDPAQAWVMQEAVARGPVKLIASVWSPPAWMKDNNSTLGGRCANTGAACFLDSECRQSGQFNACLPGRLLGSRFQNYADFLSHFAGPWAAANGVDIYALSFANEPDSGIHTWDSCQWSSNDIATFLSNHLGPTFAASQIATKVIVPESSSWDPAEPLMSATYANQSARNRVDIVAGHLYGGNPAQPFQTALNRGKRVWQTETSQRHNIWDIESALAWGKDIHDGLTGAQISAWLWFIMFAGEADTEVGGLIGAIPWGGAKASPSFFVLGNYSKFVRPGFVRIGATSTGMLDVSAYRDPTSDQVVVVAINRNAQALNVKFNLLGSTTARTMTQYITSASQSLQRQRPIPIGSTMQIPGHSIVTYVSSAQGVNRTSDILWHNVATGEFAEWIMANGQVAASIPLYTEPAEWQVQGIGDFNGDGTSDVLWRNVNTGEFTEWFMANGQVVAPEVHLFAEPAEWQVQGIGDFNGDGTSDILWRNVNTGEFAEWLMTFGHVGASIPLYTEPAEWRVQGIGDFNGDGSSDILWRNVNTGQFAEWLMVDGHVGTAITLYTEPAEWQVQGIGDFNGDGTSDVLWRNVNTGELTEWLMANGQVVAPEVHLFAEPAQWQVQGIGDLDGR